MKGAHPMGRVLLLLSALVLMPGMVWAWDWRESWRMPADVYKGLDFSVRAGVDRAARIFSEAVEAERRGTPAPIVLPRYRAAQAEWRKVQIQSEAENFDETVLAYSVFMQGCSLECAHDRNEAVKLYTEVLDLYGDVRWVSIPARYRLGCAQISMGDIRRGEATLAELAEDPEAVGEPATGDAMMDTANRRWEKGGLEEAQSLMKGIVQEPRYRRTSPRLWNDARMALIVSMFARGELADLDEVVFATVGESAEDAKRLACVRWAFDAFDQCLGTARTWWTQRFSEQSAIAFPNEGVRKDRENRTRQGFATWFASQRGLYEQSGRMGDYQLAELRICVRLEKVKSLAGRVESIKTLMKAEKDQKKAESMAWDAIKSLDEARQFELARTIPDAIQNPLSATWMRYAVERDAGAWKAAAQMLEEYLTRKPDADGTRNAKWELALILRDRLGKSERAVDIFKELNDPPRTLWELQRTYRGLGKKKEAYEILGELASIFAKEAPEAILTTARYREADGEKEKAIALYRRLLTHPEWKRSGQSSQAHQALERLGIATGGAMVNDVR